MFRYVNQSSSVTLTGTPIKSDFRDKEYRGFVVPVWNKTTIQGSMYFQIGDCYEAASVKITQRPKYSASFGHDESQCDIMRLSGPQIPSVGSVAYPDLPLIMLPDPTLSLEKRRALIEAIGTGLTNATGGATVGATLGLLFGGPPLVLPGALYGALFIGGGTGVAQYIDVVLTNQFRDFCREANSILLEGRHFGPTEILAKDFRALCKKATTPQTLDVVRQMAKAMEQAFGATACRNVSLAAP